MYLLGPFLLFFPAGMATDKYLIRNICLIIEQLIQLIYFLFFTLNKQKQKSIQVVLSSVALIPSRTCGDE